MNDLKLELRWFSLTLLWLFVAPYSVWAQFEDSANRWGPIAGGKAAFGDYNSDGYVDLYAGGKLYRNLAGKQFQEIVDAGPSGGEGIWGDYDNDGHLDLFLFTGKGALFRNQGDGTFASMPFPELPTVNSRGAVWGDFNGDGRLDLYVGGYEVWTKTVHPDAIYLGQADGTFVEHWRSPDDACYSARGVTAADYDGDGDLDVYVSNYRLQPNFLWNNDGMGRFIDVATQQQVAGIPDQVISYTGGIKYPICGHTIGSAWGDLDSDGQLDLLVGNFSHPRPGQDHPQFLRNLGPMGQFKFEDRSQDAGLAWQESFASAAFGDYDNDGQLDLYFTTVYAVGSGSIKNFPVLYRNQGHWKFENVTSSQGVSSLGPTYQAAWADVDNDGDLDLCTAGKLFLNLLSDSNWIQLDLRGDGQLVNRSAVGAIARIRVGDMVLTRQVEAGTGEGNQNSLRLHYGLPKGIDKVDVEVVWPGNRKQTMRELHVQQIHNISFNASE